MKQYLITGALALAATALLTTSCQHDDISTSVVDAKLQAFDETFKAAYGNIDPNHSWGFPIDDDITSATEQGDGITRSQTAPACPDINQPYDEAWVKNYVDNIGTEPNSQNAWDNYDNSIYHEGTPGTTTYKWNWDVLNALGWDAYGYLFDGWSDWTNASEEIYNNLKEEGKESWIIVETTGGTEGYWEYDPTFVRNFKITGTWNGSINVVASEGFLPDHVTRSNAERTVVVTGTWNITENQRVGEFGKIIIAKGGTVNVASGCKLEMVNQARLVVLPGGKLTGAGSVEVNNGNAAGEENYNGGTIDVALFNNNFGKFYNYGKFLVEEYQGGAQESNFYNHSLVHIKHTGLGSETPNARIFNACQWYCEGDMRCRNYEGINGSAFIVGGQLMVSGSEDGTSDPSYFGLAEGALVKCGSLYNNGTSWTGPTSGYAAVEIVNQIDFLNWAQDTTPLTFGYFENNIYVKCGKWDNIPTGNGYQSGETATADYKFWHIVANGYGGTQEGPGTVARGNGGVTKITGNTNEILPADEDFVLGQSGCTPGFKGNTDTPQETETITESGYDERTVEVLKEEGRVFCEDLGQVSNRDMDYNDVVFDAWVYVNQVYRRNWTITKTVYKGTSVVVSQSEKVYADEEVLVGTTPSRTKIRLLAAGGTLPLQVAGEEVHKKFLGTSNTTTMINTRTSASVLNGGVSTIEGVDPVEFWAATAYKKIIDIPIVVRYSGGEILELKSDKGDAPHKFLVPVGTVWAAERCEISTAYQNFNAWVTDRSKTPWSSNINTANLYHYEEEAVTPTVVDANVVWSIDESNLAFEGTATPVSYFSSASTSVSGGSASKVAAATAGDNKGIKLLWFAPSTKDGKVTVTWTANVASGTTLTLSGFSLRMGRNGTDGGTADVKFLVDGTEVYSATGLIPARNNKDKDSDKFGSDDKYTAQLTQSVSGTATRNVQLVATFEGIDTNKSIGFTDISISGTATK